MKFIDKETINNKQNIENRESSFEHVEMESQSQNLIDQLQADVVNGCGRVLLALDSCEELKEYAKMDLAEKIIKDLQNFHYTIGFAGGQSSGKSTVVNAILQYPLMPTCKAATTCTPVELFYSERIRITVFDADTEKQLMDYPCDKATRSDFLKLKEYACAVSALPQVIENLQPFVDGYVGNYKNGIRPDELDMQADNPRHVAVLMMMLLTVYVKQNLAELTPNQKALIELRKKTMDYFRIPSNIPNITVSIQWNSPILKSGLRILDLPGLGANAEDRKLANGKVLKGHETITKEAIASTDTMVVVQNPEMLASVLATVKQMVSNLTVREVVVENGFVPVLNMIDTCVGEAGRENALLEFKTMLQNVGIKKEISEIFPLSAIYGEYAYEDCIDKSRTLFCSKVVQEARQDGADKDEIDEIVESELKKLARRYKGSGVEALREFFRTAFIERGKIEKSFSSIAEIKALEKDIQSKIVAQKGLYEGFVGTNTNLIESAIPNLRRIANKPIDKAITSISTENVGKKISLMTGLTDIVVNEYKSAFQKASEDYYSRNMSILNAMQLTWGGFGSSARVDSGKTDNYRLYKKFQRECQCINVDMKNVNKSYAHILQSIKQDIENIFDDAVTRLYSFADTYGPNLNITIGRYKEEASPEVMKLFEDVIPVISEFVDSQIGVAVNGVNRANNEISQAEVHIANVIVSKNYDIVSAIVDYVIDHIQVNSSKFLFFDEQEKMKVDGEGGAKEIIKKGKELIGDNPEIATAIQTVCSDQIINPMQTWYSVATQSVTDAFIELQEKINMLLNDIAVRLKNNSGESGKYIKKMDESQRHVDEIFMELKKTIKTTVMEVLPLAHEKNIVSHKYEQELMDWIDGGEIVGK